MTKETYVFDKNDLHITWMDWLRCWHMARVLCMTKETYTYKSMCNFQNAFATALADGSCINMTKETYIYDKRDLCSWQKWPSHNLNALATVLADGSCIIYDKRDLRTWQKRPMYMTKMTFTQPEWISYDVGRWLVYCVWQKRSAYKTKETNIYDKNDLHITRMDWLRCWHMARVLCMTKETYTYISLWNFQNALATVLVDGSCIIYDKKRPTYMTKENYAHISMCNFQNALATVLADGSCIIVPMTARAKGDVRVCVYVCVCVCLCVCLCVCVCVCVYV